MRPSTARPGTSPGLPAVLERLASRHRRERGGYTDCLNPGSRRNRNPARAQGAKDGESGGIDPDQPLADRACVPAASCTASPVTSDHRVRLLDLAQLDGELLAQPSTSPGPSRSAASSANETRSTVVGATPTPIRTRRGSRLHADEQLTGAGAGDRVPRSTPAVRPLLSPVANTSTRPSRTVIQPESPGHRARTVRARAVHESPERARPAVPDQRRVQTVLSLELVVRASLDDPCRGRARRSRRNHARC